MNRKQTEELATNAVRFSLLKTKYLAPYISENDKGPSWDGFVFIYNAETQTKQDYFGRVPVQVKGHQCEDLSRENIRFDAEVSDLKNYETDGGVIFFVVYLTPDGNASKIYYEALTREKLHVLLGSCTEMQKTKSIMLRQFPESEGEKTSIFQSFYQTIDRNEKKQSLNSGAFLTGGIPFVSGGPGQGLPSYWKFEDKILSEDRMMDRFCGTGLHILDLNYGNQVMRICRRLKEEREINVSSFTCEDITTEIVAQIKIDEKNYFKNITSFYQSKSAILVFRDMEFLAGKTATQELVWELITELSQSHCVVLSGSQLVRCAPKFFREPDRFYYYELCR